ncbi:MAG: pantetheine-phosphate adenylyltransferase [Spirochaetia bacterium]|nr:pantetheine-phosphate adenylyltransferase [Spirochaetia bacterium]MDY5817872.1 pantetheine-phosphate adenylyltransferase [Treponema sp.]
MVKAVFAGSFDPPTNGHLDIIKRASGLFESVDVVVSVNPEKHTMFSEEERVQFLKELIKPFNNVSVHSYKGIIVNYAKEVGAKVLVRGVRSANDFGYEFELALMNQNLNPDIETVFLQSKEKYAIVKSSSIKQLAQFGGDISRMVPSSVAEALSKKYKQ